jgi:DNA-binding LacI/PurR family transcriptional regulator
MRRLCLLAPAGRRHDRAHEHRRAPGVLRAVDDLGYVPNRPARALVTRVTDTIALVVSESEDRVFGEPCVGQVVRGVSSAVAGTSRQLMVTMTQCGGGSRR